MRTGVKEVDYAANPWCLAVEILLFQSSTGPSSGTYTFSLILDLLLKNTNLLPLVESEPYPLELDPIAE